MYVNFFNFLFVAKAEQEKPTSYKAKWN